MLGGGGSSYTYLPGLLLSLSPPVLTPPPPSHHPPPKACFYYTLGVSTCLLVRYSKDEFSIPEQVCLMVMNGRCLSVHSTYQAGAVSVVEDIPNATMPTTKTKQGGHGQSVPCLAWYYFHRQHTWRLYLQGGRAVLFIIISVLRRYTR